MEQEKIFDLQVDILNLIKKHNLQDGKYAFLYNDERLSIFDLTQEAIQSEVEEILQNAKKDIK